MKFRSIKDAIDQLDRRCRTGSIMHRDMCACWINLVDRQLNCLPTIYLSALYEFDTQK